MTHFYPRIDPGVETVMHSSRIRFRPVRLRLQRLSKDTYRIGRDSSDLGAVKLINGRWQSLKGKDAHWSRSSTHSSFRTACLYLARQDVWISSDGPQDYGSVRMIRVNVSTSWYTVVFHENGINIYEDFTLPELLSDAKQAELRLVLKVAKDFAREKL